jgi:serine/threonine protein kinase
MGNIGRMENIGKYRVLKELASGATGTVYLAENSLTGTRVALKLVNPEAFHDQSSAKAFKKLLQVEASLVGKLKHPHIVQMLDAVISDDLMYIVLEYVDGGSLSQFADTANLLPFHRVAELMYKCCKALEYACSQGVIHRDIKPENIMLQGESDVKISDFGAAQIEDGDSTMVIGVGSLSYMSPEQITGESLTCQTDIYSLGVTMSKLLTGKLPFQATSRHAMIFQVVNGEQQTPKFIRPEVPDELDNIVQHATRKDLRQRYQNWAEFANDLAAFLNKNSKERSELYETEKFGAMRATSFFEMFSDAELWEVVHFSKWHKLAPGSTILKEGEMGNAFFLLTDGTVKVLRNGKTLGMLHQGDCFGEIKRMPNSTYRRTTSVEAANDCVLFEVDLDALDKASIECRYRFSESFLHVLMKRLEMANTRISQLLGQQAHF